MFVHTFMNTFIYKTNCNAINRKPSSRHLLDFLCEAFKIPSNCRIKSNYQQKIIFFSPQIISDNTRKPIQYTQRFSYIRRNLMLSICYINLQCLGFYFHIPFMLGTYSLTNDQDISLNDISPCQFTRRCFHEFYRDIYLEWQSNCVKNILTAIQRNTVF